MNTIEEKKKIADAIRTKVDELNELATKAQGIGLTVRLPRSMGSEGDKIIGVDITEVTKY